jgi:hypothetical protein
VLTEKGSRIFGRQIILPEVNAVGTGSESDVGAVVNDYFCSIPMGVTDRFDRIPIKVTGWFGLSAKLNHPRATVDEATDLFQMR